MKKPPAAEVSAAAIPPSKRLQALRARAHALKPVVRIASTGLTEGVLRELDRALSAHELVKIHAHIADREERGRLLLTLCESLGAEPVQTIGKMLIAFRARPQPEATAAAVAAAKENPRKRRARTHTSTARPSRRPAKRARKTVRRT